MTLEFGCYIPFISDSEKTVFVNYIFQCRLRRLT
jgi:hypothetical protein